MAGRAKNSEVLPKRSLTVCLPEKTNDRAAADAVSFEIFDLIAFSAVEEHQGGLSF